MSGCACFWCHGDEQLHVFCERVRPRPRPSQVAEPSRDLPVRRLLPGEVIPEGRANFSSGAGSLCSEITSIPIDYKRGRGCR